MEEQKVEEKKSEVPSVEIKTTEEKKVEETQEFDLREWLTGAIAEIVGMDDYEASRDVLVEDFKMTKEQADQIVKQWDTFIVNTAKRTYWWIEKKVNERIR